MISATSQTATKAPSPAKQDELQMRTFWRRWRDLLAGAEV